MLNKEPPKTVCPHYTPVLPMSIYPTLGSLQEVIELANSKLPVIQQNEMYSLLMIYQNTLLKVIDDQSQNQAH